MDDKTYVGIVCATLGTVLGVLCPWFLRLVGIITDHRLKMLGLERDARHDAMDEVYRLFNEQKNEATSLRDKATALMVDCERKDGLIERYRDRLRNHGIDPSLEECDADNSRG